MFTQHVTQLHWPNIKYPHARTKLENILSDEKTFSLQQWAEFLLLIRIQVKIFLEQPASPCDRARTVTPLTSGRRVRLEVRPKTIGVAAQITSRAISVDVGVA
jgi:hypothetical protein